MAQLDGNFDRQQLAHRLSQSLDDVVTSLIGAEDAETFMAALETNGLVWREIQAWSPLMGWAVANKTMNLALSTADRARQGVDDDMVEAIIGINLQVADMIDEARVRASAVGAPQSGEAPDERAIPMATNVPGAMMPAE